MQITMTLQAYADCVHALGYTQGILDALRDQINKDALTSVDSSLMTLQAVLEDNYLRDDVSISFDEQSAAATT